MISMITKYIPTCLHTNNHTYIRGQTYRHTATLTDRQPDTQTQTHEHVNTRKKSRRANIQTYKHTSIQAYLHAYLHTHVQYRNLTRPYVPLSYPAHLYDTDVCEKKTLLRRPGRMGKSALKAPNQGLESCFRRWIAGSMPEQIILIIHSLSINELNTISNYFIRF